MRTKNLMVTAGASAILCLGAARCGGEAAAPEPVVEPATPPPAAAGGGYTARDPGPFSGPEYDGDHSLPGDPVAGEVVFRTNCVACHGADGRGNGGMTGADFVRDRRRMAKNNDTLLRSIREGIVATPAMPAHAAILSDTQIRDALSYVRVTFGGTPAPGAAAAAPAAGAEPAAPAPAAAP